jgi:malate dehydrogenase
MHYVTVVGSGNVGANTAFFIAERGITDVALYDIRDGLARGKGLDMMEAAPIRKYRNRIWEAKSLDVVAETETVILAAGTVRTPGMKREDLFEQNRPIVSELAPELARLAPQAKFLVATEPVDLITTEFVKRSGLDRSKVMGIGGCLDVTRLRYFASQELGLSPENISATVIGRHSNAMIVMLRYCSVSGLPLTSLLDEEQQRNIVEQTRQAGGLIVNMAQRSSAFYAPSAAIADLVDAIHMDLCRITCVSLLFDGEYGIRGVAMSLPAVIGRTGIVRVITPKLTEEEQKKLLSSAAELEKILAAGGGK